MIAMISEIGSMLSWWIFPIMIVFIITTCGEGLLEIMADLLYYIFDSMKKRKINRNRKRKEKRAYKENMMKCKVALKKLKLIEKGKDVSSID